MHAFILAGGFATRLWPLTESRAKPLLPLAGKALLSHIVEKLPQTLPITVSTNAAFADGFTQWKKDYADRDITIVIEHTLKDEEKLGALGAVAQWITQKKMEDDILLLTGDNYFGFSFVTFLASYKEDTPLLAAYDIGDREKAKTFGTVILGPDKIISAFEEKPSSPQTTLVSTGCSIIPKKYLPVLQQYAAQHPDNVGGIFEEFLRQRIPLHCFTFTEQWFDIGSFDSYLEATKALVGSNIIMGEGSELHETVCEGSVVIGKGSRVRKGVLKDTVLFEDCVIDDCILDHCILDNACHLERADLIGKMLREKTVLKTQNPRS